MNLVEVSRKDLIEMSTQELWETTNSALHACNNCKQLLSVVRSCLDILMQRDDYYDHFLNIDSYVFIDDKDYRSLLQDRINASNNKADLNAFLLV